MKKKLCGVLLAGLALALACPGYPAPADRGAVAPPVRSEVETWIVKQVEAGEIADLSQRFPGKDARVLPARFVVALLTDALPGVKPNPLGVRIFGAVFDEPLVLDNVQINHEVWLDHCEFKASVSCVRTNFVASVQFDFCRFSGEADFNAVKAGATVFFRDTNFAGAVDFASADIAGQFHADRSSFLDEKEGVTFSGMKVAKNASFSRALFAGPADFGGAAISGQFVANGVRFDSNDGEANFYGLKVSGLISMKGATFTGPVNFGGGDISGQFLADGARFQNPEKLANFNAIKVGGTVFLDHALFAGPVDFTSAEIAGQFNSGQSRFQSVSKGAIFNGIKVEKGVNLNETVFAGAVDFGSASISGEFVANAARFENAEAVANFFGMQVRGIVSIEGTVFSGRVDFGNADISGQLLAAGSQFTSRLKEADFNGLKVAHSVFFNNAVFAGPVDFAGADLANQFHLDGARFESKEQADLSSLKIGDLAAFKGASFAGAVTLADSTFLDLTLGDARPDAATMPRLDLARVLIKRKLDLGPLRIRDLKAPSLHVEGAAYFNQVQVEHAANLSDGDFNLLDLAGSRWPAKPSGQLELQGTIYKSIRADREEAASHDALLKLVGQATYGADVYGNLEAFFTRQGYKDDADRTYVAAQARERDEKMSWHSFGYYQSWLLQGIGYGRYPGRALFACALVVGLGCWLFERSKMVPKNAKEKTAEDKPTRKRYYNRFWYSLELFLPVVELASEDAWEPGGEHRFLRNYMRIHVLLGWILVPIALAAVSGLIK